MMNDRNFAFSESDRGEQNSAVVANLRSLAGYPREMQAILDVLANGPAYPDVFPTEVRGWLEIAAGLEGHGAPLGFDEAGRLAISRVPHVREAVELYARIARPSVTLEASGPAESARAPREVAGTPTERRP